MKFFGQMAVIATALMLVGCVLPEGPQSVGKGNVVINEVNTDAKYIELYNNSSEIAEIGGWTIIKNGDAPLNNASGLAAYKVPQGVVMLGHSYAVLNCKGQDNPHGGLALGTSESGVSGKKSLLLELVDAEGGYVDHFVNTASEAPTSADEWDGAVEHTFDVACRMPDGGDWWVVDVATPGEKNDAKPVAKFSHTNVIFVDGEGDDNNGGDNGDNGDNGSGDNGGSTGGNPDIGVSSLAEAVGYVWNESKLPSITISVSENEWNNMLETFDHNSGTKQYFKGDVTFDNGTDVFHFNEVGWRLRGNTSRRRPEGNGGEKHKRDNSDWHHFHTQINFRKFHKDAQHTIGGVRKVHLKWFNADPAYVREVFCYDLFRRYGVWTAINDIYCRLWIHVEGDSKPAYYGVYGMLETIDDEYLKVRSDRFGGHEGNLWKCTYNSKGPADLKNYSDASKFGLDQDTDEEWPYELKTEHNSFSSAKSQLVDFMKKLNSKSGTELHDWLGEVIDIPLFLKTYAVNVAVGMWDDYWNNSNNYYLYFNQSGNEGYKLYFIPYDYDNTLGTSNHCGVQSDAGRQDPLNWGDGNKNPLVAKILQFSDYRALYVQYLNELVDPAMGLMDYNSSYQRIVNWQNRIREYVANDTEEDMEIKDRPANWGNHSEYRLLKEDNNFFKIKAEAIYAISAQ